METRNQGWIQEKPDELNLANWTPFKKHKVIAEESEFPFHEREVVESRTLPSHCMWLSDDLCFLVSVSHDNTVRMCKLGTMLPKTNMTAVSVEEEVLL